MKRHDAQSGSMPGGRSSLLWAAILAAAIVLAAPGGMADAQEMATWGAHFIRTSHVEGQVTIQRASEIDGEEALLNMPVIPGDRLWTGPDGRAEFQLADGMLVRIDHATKLDAEALGIPGDAENDLTVLRLWSGSAILAGGVFDSTLKTLQVDTPAASVFILEDGLTRIDIDDQGATVVSVYRGVAEVVALNSSVLVRAGQQTVVGPGYAPEEPFTFNTTELDDFGLWSDTRDLRHSANYSQNYVDESIAGYTYDFTDYGNWFYVSYYDRYCWRPYVGFGWSPYHYGYWHWYPWGYYWYSWEPWGWACYHYGRWDWIPGYGWTWIPDHRWSGGWVRWGVGDDYVGWAPLDYYDKAATVTYDQRGGDQGLAFRDSRQLAVNAPDGAVRNIDVQAWTFAKPDVLSADDKGGSYLGYDDVTGRDPMKLLTTPLALSQKEVGSPGDAVKKRYAAKGYDGGEPEKKAPASGALTTTGRRYAVSDTQAPLHNYAGTRGGGTRGGGSAGVVTRPSTRSTTVGVTPPGLTRGGKSYTKQIYDNVKRPTGTYTNPSPTRTSSPIPPRTTRPSYTPPSTRSTSRPTAPPSGTRPPSTRSTSPPPRAPSPPPRTSKPPSPPKRSSSSVSRPRAPSRPSTSGRSSSPSRSSGSSSRSSSRGKK
jgi:hypothetical protein